jgi:glycosyltransferase involved in cell wall biosynthesis
VSAAVCVATRNRSNLLAKSLASIRNQDRDIEIIVADDNSEDNTKAVAESYGVRYVLVSRPARYGQPWDGPRNPAPVLNAAFRAATADVLIIQSDDIVHEPGTIAKLASVPDGVVFMATVIGPGPNARAGNLQVGSDARHLRFSLGSIRRHHMYAVGGCDEEFLYFGHEDAWLELCLTRGLGLVPVWRDDIVGRHLPHHGHAIDRFCTVTKAQLELKVFLAESGQIPWLSSGGPWT